MDTVATRLPARPTSATANIPGNLPSTTTRSSSTRTTSTSPRNASTAPASITPTQASSNKDGGGGGMSGGAIAGIVIAFLTLLGLSVVGGFLLLKKRRRRMMASGKAPPPDPYGRSTNHPRQQRFEAAHPGDDHQDGQQRSGGGGPLAFLSSLVSGVSTGKRSPSPSGGQSQSMATTHKPREFTQVSTFGGNGTPASPPPSRQQLQQLQAGTPAMVPGQAHPSSTVYYNSGVGSPATMIATAPPVLHQAPIAAIPLQQQASLVARPPMAPPPSLSNASYAPSQVPTTPASYQQQPVYYQPGAGLVSVIAPVMAPPPSGTPAATFVQPMYQQQVTLVPTAPHQGLVQTISPIVAAQIAPAQQQQQQQFIPLPVQQQFSMQDNIMLPLQTQALPTLQVLQQPAPPVSVATVSSTFAHLPSALSHSSSTAVQGSDPRQKAKKQKKPKEEKPSIYLPADSSRPLLSQGLFKIIPDDDDDEVEATAVGAQTRTSGEGGGSSVDGSSNDDAQHRPDSEELVTVPIPGALELVSSVRGRVEQHQMQQQSMNNGGRPREPVIVGSDIVLQPLPSELKRMNSLGIKPPAIYTGTDAAPALALSSGGGGDGDKALTATPSLASAVLAAANAAVASFNSPVGGSHHPHDASQASTPYSGTTSPTFGHPSRTNTLGDALPTMGTEEYLERTDDKEEYNSSVHGEKIEHGSMLLRDSRPMSSNSNYPANSMTPSSSVPVSPVSRLNEKQELEEGGNAAAVDVSGSSVFTHPPGAATGTAAAATGNSIPSSSPMLLSRPLNMAAIADRRAATPPPLINHATKPKAK